MQRQLNTEDNVTAMQCPVNTAPPTKKQTLPSSAKSGQTAKSSNDGFRQIKIRKTRTQYNEGEAIIFQKLVENFKDISIPRSTMTLLIKELLYEFERERNTGLQQMASLVLHASAEQFLIDLFKNAGKDDHETLGIHELQQAWKEYLEGAQ
eukprot:3132826-Rhodomonas_salina.1